MLQKIDKDRLDKVLKVIDDRGIKFPVATIEKDLNVNKGNVSAYLKGKKPMSDNFYKSFIAQYDSGYIDYSKQNELKEDGVGYNKPLSMDIADSILIYQETIRDLARQGVILAEGNKVMAEGYKTLSDANKALADNNTNLIGKVNFGTPQHVSLVLEPYLKTIAGALAGKFWKDESAGMKEFRRILSGHLKDGIKSDK